MRQEFVDARRRVGLHAQQQVGEVVDGVDVVGLAGRGERVDARQVLAGVVRTDEEEVLPAEGESPFTLPIATKSPWCTTTGIQRTACRSRSRIASTVGAKT